MEINQKNYKPGKVACGLAVSSVQPASAGRVKTDGEVRECRGLRPVATGVERACSVLKLCSMPRRPLYADVNEGKTCIFTQEDDGTIYVETRVDGTAEADGRPLGRVEYLVTDGASVGNYVVLRAQDGSLSYIRRGADGSYTFLGARPTLPRFTVQAVEGVAVSMKSETVKFAKPLTEVNGAVDAEVAARVEKAWRQAYSLLVSEMHSRGQWLEPVRVQLALRLWDGTLLSVSEPVSVSPPQRSCRERVTAGLLYDSTKEQFTGAGAMALTGHGYTLRVTLEEGLPDAWSDIVAGVEVWVSKEPDALDPQGAPQMAFMHNSEGNFLTFMPPLLSVQAVEEQALHNLLGRHSLLSGTGAFPLRWGAGLTYNSVIESYAEPMPGDAVRASCILGHGGFLHVGCGNDLYTSRRGNPFVLRCRTEGAGARVRSMRAQLQGGGAFTRQYIYLSTDTGIVALLHRADGEHTNLRPVSSERLSSGEVWTSTPQGVYALTATGTLLCLRDAEAPVVLGGLRGVRSILWSNLWGELWLSSLSGTLVLVQGDVRRGYVRMQSVQGIRGAEVPALAWRQDAQGVAALYSLDREEDEATLPALYETDIPLAGNSSCRQVRVEVTAGSGGFDFQVSAPGFMSLAHGHVPSLPDGEFVFPIFLPHLRGDTVTGARSLRLQLSGDLQTLRSLTVNDF